MCCEELFLKLFVVKKYFITEYTIYLEIKSMTWLKLIFAFVLFDHLMHKITFF